MEEILQGVAERARSGRGGGSQVVVPFSAGVAQHRRDISFNFSLKCKIVMVEDEG